MVDLLKGNWGLNHINYKDLTTNYSSQIKKKKRELQVNKVTHPDYFKTI